MCKKAPTKSFGTVRQKTTMENRDTHLMLKIFRYQKLSKTPKTPPNRWSASTVSFSQLVIPELILISTYFVPIFTNMKEKSSSQIGAFFQPDFCQLSSRKRANIGCLRVWIFFSSNCSKFAVELDWNGKISHNVQNLRFFLKKYIYVFWKKILNFFWNC